MFEEPDEETNERAADPATRAKDKSDEFRMHAEFAAVFEAHRKFDAELKAGLDGEIARSGPLEDLVGVDGGPPEELGVARRIGHEPAGLYGSSAGVCRR